MYPPTPSLQPEGKAGKGRPWPLPWACQRRCRIYCCWRRLGRPEPLASTVEQGYSKWCVDADRHHVGYIFGCSRPSMQPCWRLCLPGQKRPRHGSCWCFAVSRRCLCCLPPFDRTCETGSWLLQALHAKLLPCRSRASEGNCNVDKTIWLSKCKVNTKQKRYSNKESGKLML